jgi:hypothetical protein
VAPEASVLSGAAFAERGPERVISRDDFWQRGFYTGASSA